MSIIIDVHEHIFNARDIPLEGYLNSRTAEGFLERCFGKLLKPKLARCIRNQVTPPDDWSEIDKWWCKIFVKYVAKTMGKGYYGWAMTLAKSVPEITKELVDTFKEDSIELYIPLVIDYEYWFENSVDNLIAKQVEEIYDNIIKQYGGIIHPFVPFCPARELSFRHGMKNPEGTASEISSLALVKDAIENKGYIGVKLYNSLGYKPYLNTEVEEYRKKIKLHQEKYPFKGEEFDEVLGDLYDYCIEKDVPITAHCVMDGIEAFKNASWHFGNAKFWRDVLSQERFKNLKVNLAHFGWNKKEDYEDENTWVKDICQMLEEFDTLYTDVGHHRVISKKEQKKFVTDYKKIISDFPVVKERLLFGIDWHVIKRVNKFKDFKKSYFSILQESGFSGSDIENFLGGNALKFLGLLPGMQNRERMRVFYDINNMDYPKWFKETQ